MSRIARNKPHYDLQSKKSWNSVFLTYQQFISIIALSNAAQKFWFQKLNQAFTNRYKQITVNCRNLTRNEQASGVQRTQKFVHGTDSPVQK